MSYEQFGISREDALDLLKSRLKNENLYKHCLAAEAVLQATARELGEDVDKWGLAGLLHDLDAETQPDLDVHTVETAEILEERGVDADIVEAICLHNLQAHPGKQRSSPFHFALAAGETITGLIIATALVYPDKKLSSVKPKSVRKRIKEKAFARGADREIIKECEQAGIPLADFCALSLTAMQGIADELGL
ncbi:MAG: HDIG domain-containing metalloprotein [Desulfopila sp.]|jgi:putative nucleotidyltransferase with HDIG domain|nr:HDIG domain-containing metalloprotein [Desulfopila sp.]